ncbi:MAG: protease modulator HflC [Candidatus Omnitrophica bacterium]|nr:protease modulator HflC [Candidatus Omnitrophota bacterium]
MLSFIGLVIVIVLLLANPFYVVPEGRQAVITQFGDPIGEPVTKAGLHLKIPLIQKVNMFEKRILRWDGDAEEVPTQDGKFIWVDTTARWRIKDPLQFFKSVYNAENAQSRLDDVIDSAVKGTIRSHRLIEVIRSSNRVVEKSGLKEKKKEFIEEGALEEIRFGREKIRTKILQTAKKLMPEYGIALVDVRIKRLNYSQSVRRKVYDRMIAERKRAAERFRSEARGKRAEVEGLTEKEMKAILSDAFRKGEKIKGRADAESTDIYAEAYNKDPELYSFLKTLETYKGTVDENTLLILTTESDYLEYLNRISPDGAFQ